MSDIIKNPTNTLTAAQATSCSDALAWLTQHNIGLDHHQHLSSDSRAVTTGDVFVAYAFDEHHDGRPYAQRAIDQKAAAVLWQSGKVYDFDTPLHAVDELNVCAGHIAHAYYGKPSNAMDCIAITGTNGKTSCAQWLAQLLTAHGQRCATMGTLGVGFTDDIRETGFTTPQAIEVHRLLHEMHTRGAQAMAMEVSSHALVQGRVNGVSYKAALFTNLSRDHLDYHGDMAEYEAAKARLFAWQGLQVAVINLDDPAGQRMAQVAHVHGIRVVGYGLNPAPAGIETYLQAQNIDQSGTTTVFDLHVQGQSHRVHSQLVGEFNVMNMLGVLGVMLGLGYELVQIVPTCAHIAAAAGRMQRFGNDHTPLAVVDFAHTPDALEKTLLALQPIAHQRGGKLVCVFGCGGDRDAGKRPQMGRIAADIADRVWITSDNPRTEEPKSILAQIREGVDERSADHEVVIHQEVDRRIAIQTAMTQAHIKDVILIAGKGHEAYQDIMGIKHPYSDLEQVAQAIANFKQDLLDKKV